MTVSVIYFVFQNLAFNSDDISFGESESIDVPINGGAAGTLSTVPIKKRQVTLSAKGATDADMAALEALRENNITSLLARLPVGSDLNLGNYIIPNAYVADISPGGFREINGTVVFDNIDIIVNSQDFV